MTKINLIIFFLLIIKLEVFSQADFQTGYILLTEHDTLQGLINNKEDKSNSLVCNFKKSESEAIQKFMPEQIFGYRFIDSKYYVAKEVRTKNGLKTIFVEYLLDGNVDLLFYRDNFGDHYLIQKSGSMAKEISFDNEIVYVDDQPNLRDYRINRGILRYYLQDCPELFDEIDQIKNPSHDRLIILIKRYHELECPNDACIIYRKKMPKFSMDLQPIFGLGWQNNKELLGSQFENNYSFYYGALIYLGMPLTNERIFFKTGIQCLKAQEIVNIEEASAYTDNNYQTTTYFRIPLQFQYLFRKNLISPTFGAGLNLYILPKIFVLTPCLNLGINTRISKKLYFSFYTDMDYGGNLFLIPDKSTRIISNSFYIGLTMKL